MKKMKKLIISKLLTGGSLTVNYNFMISYYAEIYDNQDKLITKIRQEIEREYSSETIDTYLEKYYSGIFIKSHIENKYSDSKYKIIDECFQRIKGHLNRKEEIELKTLDSLHLKIDPAGIDWGPQIVCKIPLDPMEMTYFITKFYKY